MGKVSDEQVRAALVEFVSRHISVCFTGVVTQNANAEKDGLIEVQYEGMLFDVKLRAVSGDTTSGRLSVPSKGSKVFCVSEGNSDNALVAVEMTDVDKYRLSIQNTIVEITNEGVVINGGKLGGMVKIEELIKNLNTIKDYLTVMNSAIATGMTAIAPGGSAGASAYNSAMLGQVITFNNMEDKKVTH